MKSVWTMGASLVFAASSLTACQEPQLAPELPERPTSDFQITPLVEGLSSPWAAAELPDGSFLITGKFGALWRLDKDQLTSINGVPEQLTQLANNPIATDGQGGLLDVAIAPDFSTTGYIYLSYSYGTWDTNGTALMRARLDGPQLSDAETIFKAGPDKEAGSHYGGKIAFLSDGSLLLSLGDGFSLREEAQKPTSHLGSVVRLLPDGTAPSDNPDFGSDAAPELFSIGHRNVQGLTVDSATGAIWEHEHGPRGGDELNKLQPGANYGWPVATYGRDYQGARISPIEDHAGFTAPAHVWTPSIAPSGLAIYRGDLFPDWNGHALIGGLASGDLRQIDLNTGQETILLSDAKTDNVAFRVRDVDVSADGSLILLIEDPDQGRLLRITPKG